MFQGDRVILGGDHYFRFNNPKGLKEREGRPNTATANHVKDFDFARQELIRVQNARYVNHRLNLNFSWRGKPKLQFYLDCNEVLAKLHRGGGLIINKVKTASMTSDNRSLGDVMDDVMYCLSQSE
jgi:hypothetical protein